jgi:hypothetical protein
LRSREVEKMTGETTDETLEYFFLSLCSISTTHEKSERDSVYGIREGIEERHSEAVERG